jgi:FkbM family methyltransferase
MNAFGFLSRYIMPLLMIGKKKVAPHTYQVLGDKQLKIREQSFDPLIVREMFDLKTYQLPGFEIHESDTVVDIGGQLGSFAVLAASYAHKGKVISYEPEKGNFTLLQTNKKLNTFSHLVIHNVAVTSDGRDLKLHISSGNSGGHSVFPPDTANGLKVKSHSLSNIFTLHNIKRINLLKIDAEGSEYDIILNSPQHLLKKIDKIILEYHDIPPDHSHTQLVSALESSGFDVQLRDNFLVKRIFRVGYIFAKRKTS